jgi:hypothetical protein
VGIAADCKGKVREAHRGDVSEFKKSTDRNKTQHGGKIRFYAGWLAKSKPPRFAPDGSAS